MQQTFLAIILLLSYPLQATLQSRTLFTNPYNERIIGSNDLTQIILEDHNYDLVNAIGLMKIGCTVTHLGNGIAITAGHCFRKNISKKIYKNIPKR